MITPAYLRLMARYNAWQNGSLLAAADGLGDATRRQDRGAFFGSIHGTFCHLLWADRMWLSRFVGSERPPVGLSDSGRMIAGWDELKRERTTTDEALANWAESADEAWLAGEVTWMSGALKREMRRPAALLAAHVFNHQTHHRGQIHAMLTATGARPEDTDLMILEV